MESGFHSSTPIDEFLNSIPKIEGIKVALLARLASDEIGVENVEDLTELTTEHWTQISTDDLTISLLHRAHMLKAIRTVDVYKDFKWATESGVPSPGEKKKRHSNLSVFLRPANTSTRTPSVQGPLLAYHNAIKGTSTRDPRPCTPARINTILYMSALGCALDWCMAPFKHELDIIAHELRQTFNYTAAWQEQTWCTKLYTFWRNWNKGTHSIHYPFRRDSME